MAYSELGNERTDQSFASGIAISSMLSNKIF